MTPGFYGPGIETTGTAVRTIPRRPGAASRVSYQTGPAPLPRAARPLDYWFSTELAAITPAGARSRLREIADARGSYMGAWAAGIGMGAVLILLGVILAIWLGHAGAGSFPRPSRSGNHRTLLRLLRTGARPVAANKPVARQSWARELAWRLVLRRVHPGRFHRDCSPSRPNRPPGRILPRC